jgi:hypothetical protein
MESAHDHLQGQPLQDGLMDIEFAWDVPETPLPPGPVPGSKCVIIRLPHPTHSHILLFVAMLDVNSRNASMGVTPTLSLVEGAAEAEDEVDIEEIMTIVRGTAVGTVSVGGHVAHVAIGTETVMGPEEGAGLTTTTAVVVVRQDTHLHHVIAVIMVAAAVVMARPAAVRLPQ